MSARTWISALFLILTAMQMKSAFAGSVFSPESCDYTFEFPGRPAYIEMFAPGIGNYLQAQYIRGSKNEGYLLRAECIPTAATAGTVLDSRDYLQSVLVSYAEGNGIRNAQYSYSETKLGKRARMRGSKQIDGTMTTYSAHAYVGGNSIAFMYVGGPSSSYPNEQVIRFLNSIRLK